jgi:hypothetical protein
VHPANEEHTLERLAAAKAEREQLPEVGHEAPREGGGCRASTFRARAGSRHRCPSLSSRLHQARAGGEAERPDESPRLGQGGAGGSRATGSEMAQGTEITRSGGGRKTTPHRPSRGGSASGCSAHSAS